MYKKIFGFAMISIWHSAFAQVEVRNEPRHKNVFENEYLRILDVHIKPGDTTLYHRHALPSVIVMLSSVETGSQLLGGAPSSGKSKTGSTWYAGYGEKPIIHRVWNQDTIIFHVMDIELFSSASVEKFEPQKINAFRILLQEKGVNTYSVSLSPRSAINLSTSNNPMLLVCTSGKSRIEINKGQDYDQQFIDRKILEVGSYFWLNPLQKFHLVCSNDQGSELICIELQKKNH